MADDTMVDPALMERKVRIVTRVARMLLFAEQNPEAEMDNFDENYENYKYLWRKIPKAERSSVIEATHEIADMTPELIAAAMAVLEPTNGSR